MDILCECGHQLDDHTLNGCAMCRCLKDYRETYEASLRQRDTEIARLRGKLEAAARFLKAHDTVEDGVSTFELQHAAVEELKAAHDALLAALDDKKG